MGLLSKASVKQTKINIWKRSASSVDSSASILKSPSAIKSVMIWLLKKSPIAFKNCSALKVEMYVELLGAILGHVHKYEAVLWTLENLRKTIFCYKMINFSLRELKFSGNMYFSYPGRLASLHQQKLKKAFCYKEMIRKSHVSQMSIYHISSF